MAGYSGTPLSKKLGIKEDYRVAIVNAPGNFLAELGPQPAGALIVPRLRSSLNLILFFAASQSELRKRFAKLTAKLTPDEMLWVAWPKRSSGVSTELSFEVVQRTGLERGLADTKVCTVNEVWSGLRFVVRLRDSAPLSS